MVRVLVPVPPWGWEIRDVNECHDNHEKILFESPSCPICSRKKAISREWGVLADLTKESAEFWESVQEYSDRMLKKIRDYEKERNVPSRN